MIKKESKGNDQRQTLEEIVRGDEAKQAASDGGDGDDDPDPYADKSASDSWQVTSYIYDVTAPYYEVLAETTDGKTTTYDYGVERIAAYSGGAWNAQKTEYVFDGRGSVAQEVSYNNSWYTFGGKIGKASVVSKSYSPFGEQLGVAMSGYGFNGQYYDSATGMLNLRARQYEPTLMRFSQRDILRGDLSIPLSLNRYLYCTNDPVNFADFSGQSLKSLWNKAKSVAKSAVKAVTRVVTNTVKAVATKVVATVAKVATRVVAAVAAAKTVGNTVKEVATAVKAGNTKGAISAAVGGAAKVGATYAAAKAVTSVIDSVSASMIADFKADSAKALVSFVADTYGELSQRNKDIINNAAARMKEMQADGKSEVEIAKVFLAACREVGKNVGETAVKDALQASITVAEGVSTAKLAIDGSAAAKTTASVLYYDFDGSKQSMSEQGQNFKLAQEYGGVQDNPQFATYEQLSTEINKFTARKDSTDFYIVAHGTPGAISLANDKYEPASVSDFGNLKYNPGGGNIYLLSCYGAAAGDDGLSAAQKIANATGRTVIACNYGVSYDVEGDAFTPRASYEEILSGAYSGGKEQPSWITITPNMGE